MFESALMRLTLIYLGIIMVISVGFSVVLYHTSSNEVQRNLRRQSSYFGIPPSGGFGAFDDFRQRELDDSNERLLWRIILANTATLVAAGAASYVLARHTLRPIQESMEAQSRFTADASHELRTPLTAMQTEIEVALRSGRLSKEDARNLLESNLEEIAKLKGLSDGLLQLTTPLHDDTPLDEVSVKEMVSEATHSVRTAAAAKQIEIIKTVGDETVSGHHHALTELLVILLDNAIKYSDPKAKITVASTVHGHHTEIRVSDTGHGIKASDIPHIFDRFYRVDTARSKGTSNDGYGLGLSIAQQLAQRYGGSIGVVSTVGKGSTFTISLPLAQT